MIFLSTENVQKLIRHESQRLGARINDITHLKRGILQKEAEVMEIQNRISETKEEIDLVEQDLAAMQTRGPDDTPMSSQELVQHFKEIRSHIVTISMKLGMWYKPLTSRPLSSGRAQKIIEHVYRTSRMKSTDLFIQRAVGQRLDLVAQALVLHSLCSLVMYLVFYPFLPGKAYNDPAMKALFEMQRKVRKAQSQDPSSRWRALTHRHAAELEPRAATWCRDEVTLWVQQNLALLEIITGAKPEKDLVGNIHQLTMKMISVAAQFNDKSNQLCTEVDHFVYLPICNQEYHSQYMKETFPTKESPTKVVLGVGLGLQLSSSIKKNSRYVREYQHPVLSRILSDNSSMLSLP